MLIKSAKKKALKVEAIQSLVHSPIQLVFHFNSKVKTAIGSQIKKESVSVTPQGASDGVANKAVNAIKLCVNQRSQLIGIRASVMESNTLALKAIEQKLNNMQLSASAASCTGGGAFDSVLKLSVISSPNTGDRSSYVRKGSTAILWLEPSVNKSVADTMQLSSTSVNNTLFRGNTKSASELLVYQLWCALMLHSGCMSISGVSLLPNKSSSSVSYSTNQSFMLLGGKIYGKEYGASEIIQILTDYSLSCALNSGSRSTKTIDSLFSSSSVVTGTVGLSGGATTPSYAFPTGSVLAPEVIQAEFVKTIETDGCPAIYGDLCGNLSTTLSLADRFQVMSLNAMSNLIYCLSQIHPVETR
jgi:hypothetical protein